MCRYRAARTAKKYQKNAAKFNLIFRSSDLRNARCPMCGEAPDLQEVKVPEIKKNHFSLSGEKLDRGRWFHFAKFPIREVSPPIFFIHLLISLSGSKIVFSSAFAFLFSLMASGASSKHVFARLESFKTSFS